MARPTPDADRRERLMHLVLESPRVRPATLRDAMVMVNALADFCATGHVPSTAEPTSALKSKQKSTSASHS